MPYTIHFKDASSRAGSTNARYVEFRQNLWRFFSLKDQMYFFEIPAELVMCVESFGDEARTEEKE